MNAKRHLPSLALGSALLFGTALLAGSGLAVSQAAAAGQIHTGGKSGAYHTTFCPRLKKVLRNAHFPFTCQTSEGSLANIARVKDVPDDIGFAQLDVFALDRAESGISAPLKSMRTDLARECLFLITKDRSLENFGDVSKRADQLTFVLPPTESGPAATFRFLQKIDPDGLGRATKVTHAASTMDAIEKAMTAKRGTVALFVQFPNPDNARFKLVNAMDGHFIPVIDRNILHQTVDGHKVYFAQETLVTHPKFWKQGTRVVTACTPIVIFTGNPDHFPPGQERVDQQDMIRTVKAAPRTQLLPEKGMLKSIWSETKSLSASALARVLEAAEKAREAKLPSLGEITEKTRQYSREALEVTKEAAGTLGKKAAPAWAVTKEKAKELGQKAAPAWEATKEKAKELGQKAAPAWEATKEKAKELGQKAAPAWEATKEKAAEAVQKAQPFWEKTKQRAQEMSRKALEAASEAAQKAREAGKNMIGDKPGEPAAP